MDDLIKYYENLLVIQYNDLPKASKTIGATVEAGLINNLPIEVRNSYDIENATGKQLDTIGKYQNVQREISGVFGIVNLDDNDFRTLIKLAILRNGSGSSLFEIKNMLESFFPGAIRVYDHMDMRLTYYIDVRILESQAIADAFLSGGLLPFPMGVGGAVVFYDRLDNFFGFQSCKKTDYKNTGLNSCSDFNANRPMMSCRYGESIEVPEPIPPDMGFLVNENLIDYITQEDGYFILV